MRFNNDSEKLMNLLFPLYDETIKSNKKQNENELSVLKNRNFDRIINNILDDIIKAHNSIEKLKKNGKGKKYSQHLEMITMQSKKDIPQPSFFNSSQFLPDSIRKYIIEHSTKYLIYKCEIGGRQFTIYFTLFDEDEEYAKYDKYATLMFVWLHIASKYSKKKCAKTLSIYIYLTPFQKRLPLDSWRVLDKDHVNSAVTTSCTANGEILLFRREEWFKVFIHETFHIFGLDFSDMSSDRLSEKLKKLFPIQSDMLAHETYTEFWATLLNSAFYSYNLLENKNDKDSFLLYFDFCIEFERLFSTLQVIKILNFMGMNYTDLYEDTPNAQLSRTLYKEKTNVFPYYVLKFILLFFHKDFVLWCDNNNTNIFNFTDTSNNLMLFYKFIEQRYNDDIIKIFMYNVYTYANSLQKQNKNQKDKVFLLNNMRMTICDFL